MTAPKQSFDAPVDAQVAAPDGRASMQYQQFLDHVGKALDRLRRAAEGMDELADSPTNEEIATAWNALRSRLQEIV